MKRNTGLMDEEETIFIHTSVSIFCRHDSMNDKKLLEMCGTSSGPGPEPGPGPGSRSWSQKIKLYRDCGRDRDQKSEILDGPGPKILI
jgi:hypothetical protein